MNYIYSALYNNHQHFACLRNIRDAGDLHTRCEKLAKEIEAYPDHALRAPVEYFAKQLV